MLKNKKIIYILLPVVLFIWGTVLFKIFNAFDNDDDLNIAIKEKKFKPIHKITRDTFSISKYDRDPFLDYRNTSKKITPNKAPVKKSGKKTLKKWPRIFYKGKVSDKKSGKRLYMLEINNQIYFLKLRDVASEIKLIKAREDKITVKFNNETKEIQIKK